MKRPKTKGFTLIELLVVIAIIAILMTLIMPGLIGGKREAKKLKCKNNMRGLYGQLFTYSMDYGSYPNDPATGAGIGMAGCWELLRTAPTPATSILGSSKETNRLFACPMKNADLPIGSSDYLGPEAVLTDATALDAAILIDIDINHADPPKEVNVLYFSGTVEKVQTASGDFTAAMGDIETPPP